MSRQHKRQAAMSRTSKEKLSWSELSQFNADQAEALAIKLGIAYKNRMQALGAINKKLNHA